MSANKTLFLKACEHGKYDDIYKHYKTVKHEENIKDLLLSGIRNASKNGTPQLIKWFVNLKSEPTIFSFFSEQVPYVKFDNLLKMQIFNIATINNNVVLAEFIFPQITNFKQEEFIRLFNDVCKLEYIEMIKWMYSICNFRDKLLLDETIIECCSNDKINTVTWIVSNCNMMSTINLCFEYACEYDAINIVLFLHKNYNSTMNFDLNFIINKLLFNMNINKVFKWITTFNKINYAEFQTVKYIEQLLEHNKIEILLYLINCEEFIFPVECYYMLLKYTCCNTNCTNLITTALTKIYDFSNVNIDDIYFTTCCLGNYEVARFLQENFKINIRKHNDIEFAYNFIVSCGINDICNLGIMSFVETNILNYKYLNKAKIIINRKQMVMWLASLCSDYIIISDKNDLDAIKCVKINTLFEKAYNSHKNKNTQKAIDIIGIKTNVNYNLSNENTCLICLETCDKLILTNCGHNVCLDGLFDWLNKKKLTSSCLYVCPMCSQLIVFSECQIIN